MWSLFQHVLFIHELHAIHIKQIPQVGASQLFCFSSVSLSMTSDFWLMLRSTSNRPDLELCHSENSPKSCRNKKHDRSWQHPFLQD